MLMVCAACRRQNSGENTCAPLAALHTLLRTSHSSSGCPAFQLHCRECGMPAYGHDHCMMYK